MKTSTSAWGQITQNNIWKEDKEKRDFHFLGKVYAGFGLHSVQFNGYERSCAGAKRPGPRLRMSVAYLCSPYTSLLRGIGQIYLKRKGLHIIR
jgi:hypothetical protein